MFSQINAAWWAQETSFVFLKTLLNLTNPDVWTVVYIYNLEVFIICLAHKKIAVSHTKLYAPELNERKGSSQKSHSGCLTEC